MTRFRSQILLVFSLLLLFSGSSKAQFSFVPDSIQTLFEQKLAYQASMYESARLFEEFEENEGIPTDSLYYAWYLIQKSKAKRNSTEGLELRQKGHDIIVRHGSTADKAYSEFLMAYSFLGDDAYLSSYHIERARKLYNESNPEEGAYRIEGYELMSTLIEEFWNGDLRDSTVNWARSYAARELARGDTLSYFGTYVQLNVVLMFHLDERKMDRTIMKEAMGWAKKKNLSGLYSYAMQTYAESYTEEWEYPTRDSILHEVIAYYETQADSVFQLQYPYFALADLHFNWGNTEKAYEYQSIGVYYSHTRRLEELALQRSELQQVYNLEAAEKEKELAENKRQDTLIFYSVVVGLLLLVMAFGVAFYITNQKRQKLIIEEQEARINTLVNSQENAIVNSLIEGREKERTYIARELHDRVGSLLSAIRLRFENAVHESENEEMKTLFGESSSKMQEAIQEVRNISRNMSTNVVADIGVEQAVKNLVNSLNKSKLIDIELDVHLSDINIPNNYALTIYRVLQELFTNSLRHSKANKIDISFVQREKEISLVFEDNGIGFYPENVKKGVGLQSISARVAEIHGELKIESSPGKGAIFIVEVPMPQLDLV